VGWVWTPNGRRWGRHGAAGLLLVHEDRYLLALRSSYVHVPDVWSLPGGAIERGESPEQAAVRECREELGDVPAYRLVRTHVVDHGGWSYTTVVATTPHRWEPPRLSWETAGYGWFSTHEVSQLPLHPGLASAWPHVSEPA
jgi:8-oxo-dGTP pyrophosphatase MutT (NUDIX family)